MSLEVSSCRRGLDRVGMRVWGHDRGEYVDGVIMSIANDGVFIRRDDGDVEGELVDVRRVRAAAAPGQVGAGAFSEGAE